jgi:hypothetical protein
LLIRNFTQLDIIRRDAEAHSKRKIPCYELSAIGFELNQRPSSDHRSLTLATILASNSMGIGFSFQS